MSKTRIGKPNPSRRRHDDPLWEARRQATFIILLVIGLPIAILICIGLGILFRSTIWFQIIIITLLIVLAIGLIEALRRSLYKDEPAPKFIENSLLPPPPADPIDPDATYTLTSDGEVIEVLDENAPPALSFKLNDEGDELL